MRIGIDISQLAYERTGVANYLKNLVEEMVKQDSENEYILFFSSLRAKLPQLAIPSPANVQIKQFKLPPSLLDFIWNTLHILPIEWFIGSVDIFISSDWTEPPTRKAKKATIVYDTTVYLFPDETAEKIQNVQKRKNNWVKKESDLVLTISESAKKDIEKILGIPTEKIKVMYPGV